MAKKQPKALRFINTLKKGYNSLLGKELAGAINKKSDWCCKYDPRTIDEERGRCKAHRSYSRTQRRINYSR